MVHLFLIVTCNIGWHWIKSDRHQAIYWLFSFISRTGIWKGTNSIRNINMLNYGIVTEDTQLNTKMDSKPTYG